jgi:hypothetical protein
MVEIQRDMIGLQRVPVINLFFVQYRGFIDSTNPQIFAVFPKKIIYAKSVSEYIVGQIFVSLILEDRNTVNIRYL